MRPLAILASANAAAEETLIDCGWDVLGGERVCLETLGRARRADLVVCEIHVPDFAGDLQRIAALKTDAPDLPIVVIAPMLVGPAGDQLIEALIDVPIIRSGAERRLLRTAIAAAL
jgi:hypothetical protein